MNRRNLAERAKERKGFMKVRGYFISFPECASVQIFEVGVMWNIAVFWFFAEVTDFVNNLRENLPDVSLPKPSPVLDSFSMDGVVRYIQAGKAKNIIVMTGAGISTCKWSFMNPRFSNNDGGMNQLGELGCSSSVGPLVHISLCISELSFSYVSAAGIPDFRSPGTGLYDNLAEYNLPHPQAIFEIGYFKVWCCNFFSWFWTLALDQIVCCEMEAIKQEAPINVDSCCLNCIMGLILFFQQNPAPFFRLAKELFPGKLKPTPCHYFIRLLHEKGMLLRTYTQVSIFVIIRVL